MTLSAAMIVFAQGQSRAVTYVDSANEIRFSAPTAVLIDRKADTEEVTAHFFFNGVSLSVTKRKINGEPYKYVKNHRLPFGIGKTKTSVQKSDSVYVRQENISAGSDVFVTLYIGTKKSYFEIKLSSSEDNASLNRFIDSIHYSGSQSVPDANGKASATTPEPIVFDTLATSPEVETSLALSSNGIPTGTFARIRYWLPLETEKLSRDLIVLRKPLPSYTDAARMRGAQGTIFANVQFRANGAIGNVTVDDTIGRDLAKNVLTAIHQIKFIPAQANGKPIDVTRTLYYRFELY